jgi:hypothetical protein
MDLQTLVVPPTNFTNTNQVHQVVKLYVKKKLFYFLATYNECGDNNWRTRVISTYDSADVLLNTVPSFSKTSNSLTISGKLKFNMNTNTAVPDDSFLFQFKQVSLPSGVGSVVVAVSGVGPENLFGGGIVIRQHLKSLKGEGAILSLCGAPRGARPFHRYRTTNLGNTAYAQTSQDVSGLTFLKLEITTSTAKCFYSTSSTGASFTQIGSTITMSFGTGPIYAGVAYFGPSFDVGTATFSKIEFTGFSGFCNNRGDCKYDTSNGNF